MGLFGNLFKSDIPNRAEEKTAVDSRIEEMLSTAEECLETGTIKGYDAAIEWFSKAEELGSEYAALRAAKCCAAVAEFYLKNAVFNEEAFEYWQKASVHALKAMATPDTEYYEEALGLAENGIIGMAFVQYMNNNAGAIENLKMVGTKDRADVRLMKALCLFETADSAEAFKACANVFGNYLTDESYLANIGERWCIEQVLTALATVNYCNMINKGFIVGKDAQSAKAIFDRVYNELTFDAAKSPMNKYLEQ